MTEKTCKVRNLIFGAGMPKICVPITGSTQEEIFRQAAAFEQHGADLAEWRADCFFEGDIISWKNEEAVSRVLQGLRQILGERPLLFTFRTREEGGVCPETMQEYFKLNKIAIRSGCVDLLDLEYRFGENMRPVLDEAHGKGIRVICSNHDFQKTPEKDEIVRRLAGMREIGADIPKMAVMPQSGEDVLTLLEATYQSAVQLDCPIVTMSMGALGAISRLSGETFGSVMTFAAAGSCSAPGQMEVGKMRDSLKMLDKLSDSVKIS